MLFNTILNDQSLNIDYSVVTGEFTISQVGNYYVTWWVSTDGAGAATVVNFGVSLNGGSPILGSSPIVTGQLNGSALVTVGATPATITLVNATGETVGFGATPVLANLIIMEVDV